ncbi:MAG: DUF5661 family protein [Flavobacteriales bacterium]
MRAQEIQPKSPEETVDELIKKYGEQHILSQLRQGIKVELEHTSDLKIALKIALDHLKEDPSYYTTLSQAGLQEGDVVKFPPRGPYRRSDIEIPLYDPETDRSVLPQYARGHEVPFKNFVAEPYRPKVTRIVGITDDDRRVVVSTLLASFEAAQAFVDAMNRGGFSKTPIERIPLGEEAGRITPQNQTVDVGPNEISTQAKKFGNHVNRDGYPPLLRERRKKKSKKKSKNKYGLVGGGLWPADIGSVGMDGGGDVSENAKEHPWGHSPPHDIKKLFADHGFISDLAFELGKMKRMNSKELQKIDRGTMIKNLLSQHNYKEYPRLVQMLLQLIKKNLK